MKIATFYVNAVLSRGRGWFKNSKKIFKGKLAKFKLQILKEVLT
jgi:hypothetical protein